MSVRSIGTALRRKHVLSNKTCWPMKIPLVLLLENVSSNLSYQAVTYYATPAVLSRQNRIEPLMQIRFVLQLTPSIYSGGNRLLLLFVPTLPHSFSLSLSLSLSRLAKSPRAPRRKAWASSEWDNSGWDIDFGTRFGWLSFATIRYVIFPSLDTLRLSVIAAIFHETT